MSLLFTPLALRGLTLDNRVVVPPLCQYSSQDGVASDWHAQHLPALAISGAGLVVVEMTDVEPIGRITPWCAGLWGDAHEEAMTRVLASCRKYGAAKIGIQIAHAGRKASCDVPWRGGKFLPQDKGGWQTIAPSAIAFGENYGTPRAMVREDFERVLAAFVDATKRAARAGFDSCEMHGAHGYLLSSFFSPLSNRREDEYGGSLENRMRFPLEVFDAVRAAWPAPKPIAVAVNASDWARGGAEIGDAIAVAQALKEHGCDMVAVYAGQASARSQPIYDPSELAQYSDLVRNEAGLPTLATSYITVSDQVNTLIAGGRADVCLFYPQD